MKSLLKILFLLVLCADKNYAQVSNTKSYQVSIDFKEAKTSNTETVPNILTANTSVVYFDGLGRPVQQNMVKSSATDKDVVTHMEYNLNGDVVREYLPVPTVQASGSYVGNAKELTNSYYNTVDYSNTLNPYSEKVLEKSPERRVMTQGFPGNDWDPAIADNHAVKFEYKANTTGDAVKKFSVTTTYNASLKLYSPSISQSGTYAANELYKNVIKDENWVSGVNNTTEEYRDKLGQVVLKRNYNNGQAHDTYYAYDIYGNLSYVLPPQTNGSITAQDLDLYSYQYKYDHRNRLVEKKLPQKEWEYLVYDNGDRMVMNGPVYSPFGDGTKGWIINKYDVLGRVVFKGYYAGSTFTSAVRYSLSQNSFTAETKTGDNTVDGVWVIYSNNSFPTNFALLNVYYYDEYWFPFAPTSFPAIEGQIPNTALRGQLTGTVTRVLTNSSSKANYMSYILYDNKYRVIRNFTTNHLGGYTQVDYKLNFSGLPTKTATYQRQNTNGALLTITDNYNYDNSNRLLIHTQQINNGALETIASNMYDELGQLRTKKTGGALGNLQQTDYTYHVRGWLKKISSILFSYELNYNTTDKIQAGTPLYNGNINSVTWNTQTDFIQRGYQYNYDHLNRLSQAKELLFSYPNRNYYATEGYNENVSYDKNGNILSLNRTGEVINGQKTEIDDLSYSYIGNQLQFVTDATNNAEGFKDGNKTGNDYTYDTFGNITTDKNKSITAISYNHQNLPYKVTFSNGGSISYTYDASGTRLSKKVQPSGGTAVTTDYLNGFQYVDNVLKFFPHPEGYVEFKNNQYLYTYQYKDHLGNVRLTYRDGYRNHPTLEFAKDGVIQVTEIMEENNYYPFGLKHKGYNELPDYSAVNKYKYAYGGKELNDELGLDLYDFGARNYDPSIGRWLNVDPLAENSRRWTPYNYAYNNPIFFVDPDGMQSFGVFTELFNVDGKKIGEDAAGKDGNVSIITDKNRAKEIEKNYKKGGIATEADVNSGVLTTLNVMTEIDYSLEEAKKITNGDEVKSVVDSNGKVHRGDAPTVLNDGENGVSRTTLPYVAGNDNVSIHSHDVQIKLNKDGTTFYNDAKEPGPDDPATFTKFKQNIIVGNLGAPNVIMINGQPKMTKPKLGAVFYDRQSNPILDLTSKAIKNIIK